MKTLYLLAIVLTGFLFTGCIDDLKRETNTYIQSPFSQIEYHGAADIEIFNSPEWKVVVEGTMIDISRLDIVVTGNKLEIEHDKSLRGKMNIEIYTPSLTELEFTGSGDVEYRNNFPFENEVKVRSTGSGDIEMHADCDKLRIEQTGSGEIEIHGQAQNAEIVMSGSGRLHAFLLPIHTATVTLTGSGDAEIQVIDNLTVTISGSGDVRYKGLPNITSTITGSGSLVDAN